MIKTVETKKEIKIGMELRFGDIWDGNMDAKDTLDYGSVILWDEEHEQYFWIDFIVMIEHDETQYSLIKITDIY